jgi:Holliday junction DNA helicase RuvA
MIARIEGTIEAHGVGFLIVSCQGLGYKIQMPETAAHARSGRVVLFTHEVQRDDGRELFGFTSLAQLELFWQLIGISGIGPKGAQKIVFAGTVDRVRERIMAGDIAFLSAVPGIGKKTAQKIILELKGILAEEVTGGALDADAVQALVGLGYQRRRVEEVLAGVEGKTTEARVRGALRLLS